jgi:hypothetical protein
MRGLDAVGILLQLHSVSPNLFGVALDDIRVVETRIDSGPPARFVCRASLPIRQSDIARASGKKQNPLSTLKSFQDHGPRRGRYAAKLPSVVW